MRLIDADALEKRIREMCPAPSQPDYSGERDEFVQVAQEVVVDVLESINSAPSISPPPNDPLTLEELREIDGEPVWVEGPEPGWVLVNVAEEALYDSNTDFIAFDDYGETWTAYHRKPEEGNENA